MLDITKEMYSLLNGITQLLDEIEIYEKKLYPESKKHTFHGKKYGFIQLQELKRAQEDGFDTSQMENPDYSANKMMILRLVLEKGYDIEPYTDKNLSDKQMAAMYVANHMTMVNISEIAPVELSPVEILDHALQQDKENRDAAKEVEANVDNIQKEREVKASGEIETNIGSMPFEDYCEIRAMQNGFNSYAEMKREGYSIERPEVKSKQSTKTEQSKQAVRKAR